MSNEAFVETRTSVHTVAEHVLYPARHQVVGRIGLAVVPGGFSTPGFGDNNTSVGLIGGELVVSNQGQVRQAPVTTLRAAGDFAGVTPGARPEVYPPTTECVLDQPLSIDRVELARITEWYELVDAALREFRAEIATDTPSDITLWPEHFDVAIRAAEINYGGLAGDATNPAPYVYVGPPTAGLAGSPDPFWNVAFGASRSVGEIATVEDAVEFFRQGRAASAAMPRDN